MSKALVKSSGGTGVVPAVASALIPGVGQWINGESDKGLGVFVVSVVTGAAFLVHLPLVGGIFGLAHIATRLYAIGDGYVQGRRKK